MYVNKCVKCGREFETKNPKRVICPDCLYPDKKMMVNPSEDAPAAQSAPQANPSDGTQTTSPDGQQPKFYSSYSAGEGRPQQNNNFRRDNQGFNRDNQGYNRGGYNQNRPQQGGYRRDNQGYNRDNQGYNRSGGYNQNRPQQGGYRRDNPGYNRDNQGYNRNNNQGYNRDNQGYNRSGGYNQNRPQQGGFNRGGGFNNNRRPQQGGFNRGGFNNRRPMNRNQAPRQLLVSREQLEQIELLYKVMLPLPNPDAHEVIGEKIGLEPRKVFFGINLVRQKMLLPKLPFPKRKLAISPDQLFAIKNLYEPLLPLPPIGCHKIIASQLKMDEWRVHVGIGLIRSQMGLQRWNQEREDCPEEFKNQNKEAAPVAEVAVAVEETVVEEKPKRGRKPKKVEEPAE